MPQNHRYGGGGGCLTSILVKTVMLGLMRGKNKSFNTDDFFI